MLLADIIQLTTPGTLLLAQDQDWDWGNLIYLGVLALFGVLNWVVGKYKEWIGDKSGGGKESSTADGDVVYDVTLDDGEDFVLNPSQASSPTPAQTPSRPAPPRQPTPPRAPIAPVRPAQPAARPAHRPPVPSAATPRPMVAQPVQAAQGSGPRQSSRAQTQSTSAKASSRQTAARKPRADAEFEVEVDAEESPMMNIAGVEVRSLRDAVILSEVLAPPLAIRQIDGRGSGFDRPNL